MQRILIVEDEPAIADNIAYVLETEGFEVVRCATGGEASEALAADNIALIVLDVGLPDCSGFDLCKEIRKTSAVPIIFLTARSDEIDRVVGLEIGGDDYMPKPFSPRELAARVKAVLRRTQSETGSTGESPAQPPLALDPHKMIVHYFGTPLDLSRYEFRILEVLMRRPGWVYSRDKLMELVWESPEASMDRTVDTHIKTIRAKLREVRPDIEPIKTHRGVGYSLRDSW
ncbi:MAG: two-component system response regulator CreB [Nitrospiraceae bacterium]|nr:two-component system response regulator CreB [Nitrospiraceae bacterium]